MKRFDSTKPKYIVLFRIVIIFTNFIHKHRMDFTFEIIGEQLPDLVENGWDEDF
jgi:flagellar biosynthesis protein FliQ